MKMTDLTITARRWTAARLAACLLAAACFTLLGCIEEMHISLEINEDGSAATEHRLILDRAAAEQMAQMQQAGFGATDDEEPLTDEELIDQLQSMVMDASPLGAVDEGAVEIIEPDITIEGDLVTMVVRIEYADLEALVTYGATAIGESGSSAMMLDTDDQGRLRLTMDMVSDEETRAMMAEQMRQQGRFLQYQGSFSYTMPGEIVSSTWPEVDGRTTRFEFDTADRESLDHMIEVMMETLEIVSEPGGLDLAPLPLDSRELAPDWGPGGMFSEFEEVPVEDAEDYFGAEVLSVTTVSTRYFEEGLDHLTPQQRQQLTQFEMQNGTTIQARLHAPQDRFLLSVEQPSVTEAFDEQDRPIETSPEGESFGGVVQGGMHDDELQRSADFQLQLGLPHPDAEAIEELRGELVAVTFTGYREKHYEDVEANDSFDLDDLAPGATLTVTELTLPQDGAGEGGYELEITGPESIKSIEFEVEVPGANFARSYTRQESSRQTGDEHRRSVHLRFNTHQNRPGEISPRLILRLPENLRRERVEFELFAIDLF